MKTVCPPGYHHNDFVVAHALGHRIVFRAAIESWPES